MKVISSPQVKVVKCYDANAFENTINDFLIEHRNSNPKLQISTEHEFYAIITYDLYEKIAETVSDEFELRGEIYHCEDCPYMEVQTDGRRKSNPCRYCEGGFTSPNRKACEVFYKRLLKGEINGRD